jgi:hypothetical protein
VLGFANSSFRHLTQPIGVARWTNRNFLCTVSSLGKEHSMEINKNIDAATRLGAVIGFMVSAVIYALAIGPLIYHYVR